MKLNSISFNDRLIEFEITHRPAVTRRIHLEINDEGDLRVVAPRRMSRRAIQKTLQDRAHHVMQFLDRARSRQQDLVELLYIDGEKHLFMGQSCRLEILERHSRSARVELAGGKLQIMVPDSSRERVQRSLVNWYRQRAQQLFSDRLAVFSHAASWTGEQTPPMRLRLMKRTWGNCSSKGLITLNPHLVKAPPECIDYVIAHEVCHLKEHNHGRAFYGLQEKLYPDWREARHHLHHKGHIYLNM